jgi:N-acetylglutamate synthase
MGVIDPLELMRATWPPASTERCGPFTLRDGAGGGKRVAAATCEGEASEAEITAAERAMDGAGRQALFALTPAQAALDRSLALRGYLVLDPTRALSCSVDLLTEERPHPASGFAIWPPLRVMREIWSEGRIGPARLEVMGRAAPPRTAILGRVDDQPAGAAFVAVRDGAAMVHALEIREAHRRKGLGGRMMRHAARWAASEGAGQMVVLVTEANHSAIAFYESLGMIGGRCYHYRIRP